MDDRVVELENVDSLLDDSILEILVKSVGKLVGGRSQLFLHCPRTVSVEKRHSIARKLLITLFGPILRQLEDDFVKVFCCNLSIPRREDAPFLAQDLTA